MALPLMLGAGVDYTIFIQLALRRHGGDLGLVRRSVGRALMLCGGTAMAGFGSLGFSSNPGMASLGRVCAVGIGANMIISVFLLPAWWVWLNQKAKGKRLNAKGGKSDEGEHASRFTHLPAEALAKAGHVSRITPPSAFYRRRPVAVRPGGRANFAVGLVKGFFRDRGRVLFSFPPQRREVVVQNFLPASTGDRSAAEKAAHRLHRKIRLKTRGPVAR